MISAELWEPTSFFEVGPVFPHPEDPWPYTEAVFQVEEQGRRIEFANSTSYCDLTLTIACGTQMEYELKALAVLDVRCSWQGTEETLEILFSNSHSVLLKLKPTLTIRHHRTGLRESQTDDMSRNDA